MSDLWYGLYQHGGNGTFASGTGSTLLTILQARAVTLTGNATACQSGIDVLDFACSVAAELNYDTSAATGEPDLAAYGYFLGLHKTGEKSLAYMVSQASENKSLTSLASAALEVYKEFLKFAVYSPGIGSFWKLYKGNKFISYSCGLS